MRKRHPSGSDVFSPATGAWTPRGSVARRGSTVHPARLVGLAAPLALAVAAGCAPAPAPATPVPPAAEARLAAVVDSILATPPFHRTHWGVAVYDGARGGLVFGRNQDENFVPASNMKLVIASAALAELGPDYRYRTELRALGPAASARDLDALLLVGRGDPTLSERFHDRAYAALDSLADSVAVAGIRHLPGGVVIDGSYFADPPFHSTWSIGNLHARFAAGTAAFGVEEGTLRLVLTPGEAVGRPARFETVGVTGAGRVRSDVLTGGRRDTAAIRIERRLPGDTLVLSGILPAGAPPDTLILAAPDPADHAARALGAALERRGVRVDRVSVVTDTAEARALQDAAGPPLATWVSPPLAEIVAAILLPSQNWIAEQVLKTLGAERGEEGSWAGGLEVQRRHLVESVRLDSTAFFLRDASGLSHQNLLTPSAVIALLEHARVQAWAPAFAAGLPRPGVEGGTLSGRLAGLEEQVAAKTGTITHVNGLSGYIVTASGRDLTFSILTNATGWPAADMRRAMDRIVREIATW